MKQKPVRILIVDDNYVNLSLLGRSLKTKGYEIMMASDGAEAIDLTLKMNPDLILLDIMMPEVDGIQVCKKIKADKKTAHIPVIFLTARSDINSISEGFNAGAVDYITKPFNLDELVIKIYNHSQVIMAKKIIEEQKEKLNRANQAKAKLFSVISHDLRSPLGGLEMLLHSLRLKVSNQGDDQLDELLDLFSESLQETKSTLTNLLHWSRMELDQIMPAPSEFLIRDTVEETVRLLKPVAGKKNIEFDIKVPDSQVLFADPTMVKTILYNVIHNAVKFSYQGSVVTISSTPSDKACSIDIRDHGRGIEREQLHRLLHEMNHESTRGTAGESGTGLGLNVCREFVASNNGSMTIDSEPGNGTLVSISLPELKMSETE